MTEKTAIEKPQFPPVIVQCAGFLVAIAVAWGINSSQVGAIAVAVQDHEVRLRELKNENESLRRDILTGLLDLKGEFSVIKTRLTAIERAIKL